MSLQIATAKENEKEKMRQKWPSNVSHGGCSDLGFAEIRRVFLGWDGVEV